MGQAKVSEQALRGGDFHKRLSVSLSATIGSNDWLSGYPKATTCILNLVCCMVDEKGGSALMMFDESQLEMANML